jgi:4-hydroxybenzoate polyprenyltransferase
MSSVAVPKELEAAPSGWPRTAAALVAASRPRQWTKNLFVFAGIVFAAKITDPGRWLEAGLAFAAYSAASSGAYLFNDVNDAADDRLHPTKRHRPIASGALNPKTALLVAVLLMAFSALLAAFLGPESLALVVVFVGVQIAYSTRLKRVVLIDVLAISALFVIRAAAGAAAVHVRISPWLLLCTGLLALFLGLAKRRAELVLIEADETPGRPVLGDYSLALVDQLVTVVASCSIVSYSLYSFTARDSKAMMATIPFVLFGVFRYLLLIHRDGMGEEPENVLIADEQIQVTVLLWAVTAAVILALHT